LTVDFKIEKTANGEIRVEVIKVNNEKPQAFGYPVGSFDNNQEENSPFMKVKIKAIMKIGEVLYDSIPAALAISTWDKKGEMSTSYVALKAGVNEVQLLKAAAKFRLHVSKWGTTDEMIVERANVDEETVYTLGGNKEAKKLKSEVVSKLVNGRYVAESKAEYRYDASGKLQEIKHYLKRSDNTPYLASKEQFEYSAGRISKRLQYDEKNNLRVTTSFVYNGQGKVINMLQRENGQEVRANVAYTYGTRPEIKADYKFTNSTPDKIYNIVFTGGNVVEAISNLYMHTGVPESYTYDFNINPYIHLNLPDLYLSTISKNNVRSQYLTPNYGQGPNEMQSFAYMYDDEGYPKELVKTVKSDAGGYHSFTTKTVYLY